MKFRYVGEKEDMQVFGYDFSGGKITDVTDENAIKKLSGNTHFESVEEDKGGEPVLTPPNQTSSLQEDHSAEEFQEMPILTVVNADAGWPQGEAAQGETIEDQAAVSEEFAANAGKRKK